MQKYNRYESSAAGSMIMKRKESIVMNIRKRIQEMEKKDQGSARYP